MDKLTVDAPIATTVTVNGIEITSKADWDRVLKSLHDTLRENERLRKALEQCKEYQTGTDLDCIIDGALNSNKESDNG